MLYPTLRRLAPLCAGIALTAASTNLFALSHWAAVASTGTLDPDTASRALISGSATLAIKPNLVGTANNVKVRFPVHDIGAGPIGPVKLVARFRDQGAGSSVSVTLMGMTRTSPTGFLVVTRLFSNSFPASITDQTQSVTDCDAVLDFSKYIYYIDATLTRVDSTGNPLLLSVEVQPGSC